MDEIKKKLTIEEAYDAMIDYLEGYLNKIDSIDICCLISDMMLLWEDDISADPAAQEDWDESVEKILKQIVEDKKNIKLSIKQAYDVAIDYLEGYYERTTSQDVANLISSMKSSADSTSTHPTVWEDWNKSVKKVLKKEKSDRPYLKLTK